MKKAVLNWSGGKDASFALYKVQLEKTYDVAMLLTTVNADFDRISMHGVRRSLLIEQAKSIGIPSITVEIPAAVNMAEYDQLMKSKLSTLSSENVQTAIFGDIFLEDLRKYREEKLAEANFKGHFPLWKIPTAELAVDFIKSGFKAIVVCTNAKMLGEEFVGRDYDESFLADLPSNVDPCGENGEFHTFVWDGPIFDSPVHVKRGEKVLRTYEKEKDQTWDNAFWFCDLFLDR